MVAGWESRFGGILGLVALVEEHGSAIDYDLLTLTSYSLDDIGDGLPWSRFRSFIRHLPAGSALYRELEPDQALWSDGLRTADVLADIFDLLQSFRGTYVNANSKGRKVRNLKPYPRPWLKPKMQHIGRDPIPIKDFDSWWEGGD